MGNVLIFILGALFGGIISIVTKGVFGLAMKVVLEDALQQRYKRILRKVRFVKLKLTESEKLLEKEFFHIGKWHCQSLVIHGVSTDPYGHGQIICQLNDRTLQLPPEVGKIRSRVEREQAAVAKKHGLPQFFNGPMVAFSDYSFSSLAGSEDPLLFLKFKPTDYYTYLSTAMSLDTTVSVGGFQTTLRDRYLRGSDLARPVTIFATSFCVDLSLVTSDGFLAIAKRSSHTLNYKGYYAVPIMETVHPGKDKTPDGELDVFATALRGVAEEVGLEVKLDEVQFFSLHVDPRLYIYGLTGAVVSEKFSRNDLMSRRSMGVKDKWESPELLFIDFSPHKVAEALRELGGVQHITPSSFVSIIQTLIHEFGAKAVEKAFMKIS